MNLFKKGGFPLILIAALSLCILSAHAQVISVASIQTLLKDGIITIGQPATVNGQTFLVTTNSSGGYNIQTTGPSGNLSVAPPTTPAAALATAQQYVNENNPTNSDFYGTNELVARVGAVYLQNYGQSVIEIGVEKYGLLPSAPQLGIGGALFQGNRNGSSATAGGCGFIDYRKIIGDVSAQIGGGGGYDNWSQQPMALVKLDIEYRQNKHLGEYVGIAYGLEKGFSNASSAGTGGGLMVRGGINYAF